MTIRSKRPCPGGIQTRDGALTRPATTHLKLIKQDWKGVFCSAQTPQWPYLQFIALTCSLCIKFN
jgi:hypothetical protein